MPPSSQNLSSKSQTKDSVNNIVENALVNTYKRLNPNVEIYLQGYVKNFQDNLLTSVRIEDFVNDLLAGAGNELESKFPAIYSSAALVINSFAPFRPQISNLSFPPPLSKNEVIRNLEFEKQCHTGLKGIPPHLDVLLTGSNDNIIAIESKLTEILHQKTITKIPVTYFDRTPRIWKGGVYHDELVRIRDGVANYRYLDAPQLIKHAFGLTNTYMKNSASQNRKITLLYLYWEPANIDSLTGPLKEVYKIHAEEILKFKTAIGLNTNPSFESMSYPELWNHWEQAVPTDLENHVKGLKKRYLVNI